MDFSIGAIAWGTVITARKMYGYAKKAISETNSLLAELSGTRKAYRELTNQSGKQLQGEIERIQEQKQNLLEKSESLADYRTQVQTIFNNQKYFLPPIDIQGDILMKIAQNPTDFGIKQIQLLQEVRQLSFYIPTSASLPFIFRGANNDIAIGNIPIQVFRHNFIHPWDTPITLDRFETFGISGSDIMPEVANGFQQLSYVDQLYFSELYKDYYELARSLGKTSKLPPNMFFNRIYALREKVLRQTGAHTVLFTLTPVRLKNGSTKIKIDGKYYR